MREKAVVRRTIPWRELALLLGLIGITLLLPLLANLFDWERRFFFALHGICAQSHNLITGGVQFPLCARDSGIYTGLMVTLGVIAARGRLRTGRLPPLPISLTLLGLMVVMGMDGLNSTVAELGLPPVYEPRDDLRLLTGLGFGIGLAVGLTLVANHTLLAPDLVDFDRAPIHTWRDLAMVALAHGLVALAIAANQPLLAWPLVILSLLGVTGVIVFAIGLPISAFAGLSGRVRSARQLLLPGIAGLLLGILFLAVLARWKIELEAQGLLPPPLVP